MQRKILVILMSLLLLLSFASCDKMKHFTHEAEETTTPGIQTEKGSRKYTEVYVEETSSQTTNRKPNTINGHTSGSIQTQRPAGDAASMPKPSSPSPMYPQTPTTPPVEEQTTTNRDEEHPLYPPNQDSESETTTAPKDTQETTTASADENTTSSEQHPTVPKGTLA